MKKKGYAVLQIRRSDIRVPKRGKAIAEKLRKKKEAPKKAAQIQEEA